MEVAASAGGCWGPIVIVSGARAGSVGALFAGCGATAGVMPGTMVAGVGESSMDG